MIDGAGLIASERQRQLDAEGWTPEHDDGHELGELIQAAIRYADNASPYDYGNRSSWPFEASWWKPSDDPVRDLVKAGALIAAEIDRLQRLAVSK